MKWAVRFGQLHNTARIHFKCARACRKKKILKHQKYNFWLTFVEFLSVSFIRCICIAAEAAAGVGRSGCVWWYSFFGCSCCYCCFFCMPAINQPKHNPCSLYFDAAYSFCYRVMGKSALKHAWYFVTNINIGVQFSGDDMCKRSSRACAVFRERNKICEYNNWCKTNSLK